MMIRCTIALLLFAVLAGSTSATWAAPAVRTVKNADGSTTIYDPEFGMEYLVKGDPAPIIKAIYKRGKVEGFGRPLTQSQFGKPKPTVAQAVTNTTQNTITKVGVVTRTSAILRPVQRLFATVTRPLTN